jgi:hypothetical protein
MSETAGGVVLARRSAIIPSGTANTMPARGSAAFGKLKPFSGPAQHESQRIVAAHFVRFRAAKRRSGDDRVQKLVESGTSHSRNAF